jgi:hypoxanthine phosphoribosyltransferase
MNFPTAADHDPLIAEVLVGEEELRGRVVELGAEISRDYVGLDPVLVGVLKGAVFFIADLVRTLTVPCEIDFMAVSSYGNTTDSSGVVLIVEDIVDSGLTLSYLVRNLEARKPASLEVCALLTKPARRKANIRCRYVGFEIANRFAIGYGLDYAERYRSLPYVAALDESKLPEPLD